MELDTGGAVSVMSIRNFRKISSKQIKPTNIVFKTYKADSLIPLGYVTVGVQYKNQKVNLNLYIVKENLDTILGREWLYKIQLDWLAIKAIRAKTEQNLNNLLREYKDIFDDKLGEISNYEAKLKLRPGVKPIFCRVRAVPFALKAVVNAPVPKNVHEATIATIANPLNNLTKKNVRFLWSKDCQAAFEQIKKEICSPKVLVHYDPSLPLTLASGASPVDFLSRLPKTSEELEVKDGITIFQISQIEALPVTSKELRQDTGKAIELGPLLKALREEECSGRELHAGHLGIVKMKAIARSFVYWKNINKDIEEAAKNCVDCARYKANPTKAKVHYWEYPSMPWGRIHVDFAGPIFEHTFFQIVDAHSKWLEVYPMKTTTTKKTIECLRDSFARFGLPRVLVSDNGSQFTSYEFQRFMQRNGVKHKTSAPFKPSSNGQAERYVATLKQSLRAMRKYEGTIKQKLSTFLMQYQKAPNVTTAHSPAMLFLKRYIRTRIDLLLPELKTRIQDKL
ncbi:uncharacterized protein K02A2.6 [Trichonephila clavata]|uniref:RNA-directed DNA polymerase n=1 Tax=Trichonephila clavata TaxID=2740835 RepID=A0A8X6J283_TRICU|nr:uncharacterized protein K02A2.6 [Trichonephila clavata]